MSVITVQVFVTSVLIMLDICVLATQSTESDFICSFTSSSALQQITIDANNVNQPSVYVSGTNVLFKLTPELQLDTHISTGPVYDNDVCRPSPSPCQIPRKLTDNIGSVLEIGDFLLVCGTAKLGLCSIHSLLDINVSHPLNYTNQINYLGSKTRTFAFFANAPNRFPNIKALYAGITYDQRLLNLAPKMFSSLKVSHVEQAYSIEYLLNDPSNDWYSAIDLYSADLKRNYVIKTVFGFELRNFVYFLTVQRGTVDSRIYHTRLGRFCKNELLYRNFMQIPLECHRYGQMYNVATAAWIHNVTSIRSAMDLGTRLGETLLYVTFGISETGSSVPDPSKGTALCVYKMKHVRANFISQLKSCFKGYGQLLPWVTGRNNNCVRKDVDITDDDAFCADPSFSNEAIEGMDAITQEANFTASNQLFTSVAATTRMNKTVTVLGRQDGVILKLLSHELHNGPYATYNLSKDSEVKVEQDVTFDLSGEHLYLLTGNTVHRFPMDSCRVHLTCEDCILSNDPQPCGWCDGMCTVYNASHCPSVWFSDRCLPKIHSFTPTLGPTKGGTQVTIKGENFGSNHQEASVSVKIGPQECVIQVHNMTQIICETNAVSSEETRQLVVEVWDLTNSDAKYNIRGKSHSTEFFEYLKPEVYKFSPLFGPVSGGTNITITGKNFHVGSQIRVTAAFTICNLLQRQPNMLVCSTNRPPFNRKRQTHLELSSGKLIVEIDQERLTSEDSFSYKLDPTIDKITPSRSFLSGGVTLHVSGENLNSVQTPWLGLTVGGRRSPRPLERCTANDLGTLMECHSPNISQFLSQSIDPNEPLQAYLWFQMDGVDELYNLDTMNRPLSQFLYYPDPYFSKFQGPDNIQYFDVSETYLDLHGDNLLLAYAKDSIKIRIGNGHCNITSLAREKIQCRPGNKPQDVNDNEPKHEVQVQVGYLLFDIGFLKYTSARTVNGWIVALPIIISLVIIAMIILVIIAKRRHIGPFGKDPDITVSYNPGQEVTNIQDYGTRERVYNLNLVNRRTHDEEDPDEGASSPYSIGEDNEILPLLKSQKMLIDRDCLDLKDVVGQGHFGCVYEGLLLDAETNTQTKVAVKTLHNDNPRDIDVKSFLNEALLMVDFNHPNVLTLIGICLGKDKMPLVVLPYMKHGDLLTYIRKSGELTIKTLILFGVDIAKGMNYLGELKFVHRDLAARNCMLDDNMIAKVADFGLSRDIYEKDYYSSDNKKTKLPVKWMALESLEKGTYNAKTDVWSFGVVLWELVTRGINPYPDVDNWDIGNYLRAGRRLPKPDLCPEDLYQIMHQCWRADPEMRPTFEQLAQQITDLVEKTDMTKAGRNISNSYVNVHDQHKPKAETDV